MYGKCPKCEATVMQVSLAEISIPATEATWRGITYSCIACGTVLGVQMDPVSLKADTVSEIADAVRGR
jgi:transcription elongation factor Elf1